METGSRWQINRKNSPVFAESKLYCCCRALRINEEILGESHWIIFFFVIKLNLGHEEGRS